MSMIGTIRESLPVNSNWRNKMTIPNLYRYHTCEENLCTDWHAQSTCICHPKPIRTETEHKIEGTVESQPDTTCRQALIGKDRSNSTAFLYRIFLLFYLCQLPQNQILSLPKQKASESFPTRRLLIKTATTYSPTCAVPSAWQGLTSLFGMGRGGTLVQ